MAVRVQEADFDVGAELDKLTSGNKRIGVCSHSGKRSYAKKAPESTHIGI